MKTAFTTVRTEGGILPADLLTKVLQRDATIGGVTEESYHVTGEKLNEAISRSWNRLLGVWRGFQEAAAKLPANDFGTTVTREKWLLPLFEELHYGRLKQRTFEIDGTSVPISHGWENVPIHLTGFRISIDRRTPGAAGAAKKSPHSLLQEFLNRSAEHAWGIVSNGETLRLLRDNVALTRQAFVEFDLKAMMEGEVYADFALLWMLCHQSRLDASKPEEFWLERWSKFAQDQGIRALDQLRDGVAKAIEALGAGFLGQRDNQGLRDALAAGELDKQEYYRQLLRIVYRLLFLFVAEDRGLLLDPEGSAESKDRYRTFYSTQRLRELASSRRGSRHRDLYEQLRFVFRSLDAEEGCGALALKPLGSFLFSREATAALDSSALANADLLAAVRHLSVIRDGRVTRVVDFRNLRSEELGSVYEALLEMHPEVHLETGAFELKTAAGNERKTTGSYYTPESLVQLLLDSALDPVLAEAAAQQDAEQAILDLNVCDPACGSGHFLIAAAHRIAKKLASVRTGDEEADPGAMRKALRDVVGHCIYGVDINPMAVELCKVALWMEALNPGKPLSFLEQKIQCGNSLVGATPNLLSKGIPDEAFEPIEGDDKEVCKRAKAQNKHYRQRQQASLDFKEPWERLGDLVTGLMQLELSSDETLADVRGKEQRWKAIVESTGYLHGQLWADAWCAAFMWRKADDNLWPITEETFRKIERNPYSVEPRVREEIRRVAEANQFVHWHLRFPEVFGRADVVNEKTNELTGWSGGFDVVLGNPPWEMPEADERTFFFGIRPDIASELSAHRRAALILSLRDSDSKLSERWSGYVRRLAGLRALLTSARFPLSGSGRLNLYKSFVELGFQLLSGHGHMAVVIPSGLSTNAYERPIWEWLVRQEVLHRIYDFENKRGLFADVDSRTKFSVLSVSRLQRSSFDAACWLTSCEDLLDNSRTARFTVRDLERFSPKSLALPQFRKDADLRLLDAAHRSFPCLIDGWSYTPRLMFSTSDRAFAPVSSAEVTDPRAARTTRYGEPDINLVPVYEGKMVGILDHRQADVVINPENRFRPAQERPIPAEEKRNPLRFARPASWIAESVVRQRRFPTLQGDWELAFCDVTSATNERTAIAAIVPLSGLTRSLPAIYLHSQEPEDAAVLLGLMSTFAFDFFCRLKVAGNHLTQDILGSIPAPTLETIKTAQLVSVEWIRDRVVELIYTASDLAAFGTAFGHVSPFQWDDERRFQLCCELSAAAFHLYRFQRADVEYVMDTFPIVREDDLKKLGRFETKERILELYDRMKLVTERGDASEEESAMGLFRRDETPRRSR